MDTAEYLPMFPAEGRVAEPTGGARALLATAVLAVTSGTASVREAGASGEVPAARATPAS